MRQSGRLKKQAFRSGSSSFHEGISIAICHNGGQPGEQGGIGAKDKLIVIDGNKLLIVGLHLLRIAVIRGEIQLDRPPKQPSALIDLSGPDLIPLLQIFPISGEVSTQRDRNADLNGLLL